MAYNRDWDSGKDSWNSAAYGTSSWNNAGGSNVRPRDEDYYNDGKRRKFNNGVCNISFGVIPSLLNLSQSYDVSQANDESNHDTSYGQGEYPQDYSHEDRSQLRGGFNKKRIAPSEPSPHVIFLGLDPDFTEADVRRLS